MIEREGWMNGWGERWVGRWMNDREKLGGWMEREGRIKREE